MRKPRMTKSERAWYLDNYPNLKAGLLSKDDYMKWFALHFDKTF